MFKPLDQDELQETLKDMVMGAPEGSGNNQAVDLYTPAQKIKDAVKDIIDSGNAGAAEQLIECLNGEVKSLQEFLGQLETV